MLYSYIYQLDFQAKCLSLRLSRAHPSLLIIVLRFSNWTYTWFQKTSCMRKPFIPIEIYINYLKVVLPWKYAGKVTWLTLWLRTFPSTSLPLLVTNTCWPIISSVPKGIALKNPGPIIWFSENSSTLLLHSSLTLNFFSTGMRPSSLALMAVTKPILQTPSLQQTDTREPIIDLFGILLLVDILISLLFLSCWNLFLCYSHPPVDGATSEGCSPSKFTPKWMTGPVVKQLISIRCQTLSKFTHSLLVRQRWP